MGGRGGGHRKAARQLPLKTTVTQHEGKHETQRSQNFATHTARARCRSVNDDAGISMRVVRRGADASQSYVVEVTSHEPRPNAVLHWAVDDWVLPARVGGGWVGRWVGGGGMGVGEEVGREESCRAGVTPRLRCSRHRMSGWVGKGGAGRQRSTARATAAATAVLPCPPCPEPRRAVETCVRQPANRRARCWSPLCLCLHAPCPTFLPPQPP